MHQENQTHLFTDLEFDRTAKQYIRSMASWAMIVVVVAVIGYIITIAQLFSGEQRVVQRSEGFDFGARLSGSDTTFSIIAIVIGLLINFFLYRFASQARNGIDGLNQDQLNRGFNSLKTYFMIMSVILIVVFVVVLLAAIMVTIRSV